MDTQSSFEVRAMRIADALYENTKGDVRKIVKEILAINTHLPVDLMAPFAAIVYQYLSVVCDIDLEEIAAELQRRNDHIILMHDTLTVPYVLN